MKLFNELKVIFTRFLSNSTPRQLNQKTLINDINQLIAQQFDDAKHKKDNSHIWGGNGVLVERAAMQCSGVLAWQHNETIPLYFARVLPRIASLAEEYRRNPCDPDGFGLGTVREVENALIKKSLEYQQRN